jgi:hypothetical protein
LVAWQAISKSASFALGWATALYFGQVPGRQGRILSVISLLAAGWVVLVLGFAAPIFIGAALEAAGVIEDNFDVQTIHYLGLTAGVVLVPLVVAAAVVIGEFDGERTFGHWLRLVPISYPATFMLGVSVLQMVLLTPVLLFQRWRRKRTLLQVPIVLREGADDGYLLNGIRAALASIGIRDVRALEAHGPKSWPMRTVAFAANHLLGAVVRGEPIELQADGLEVYAYATTVSILGPKGEVHRARAAIERELAFCDAFLTWNEEAQAFERELVDAGRDADGDPRTLRRTLDGIQERFDAATLNSEEWNVLYRLRLQVEARASRGREKPSQH